MDIANMFKFNIAVSIFLKRFVLIKTEEVLRVNKNALSQEEFGYYQYFWKEFQQELNVNNNPQINAEAYYDFLNQSFGQIKLDTANENTLLTAKNLIEALSYFGSIPNNWMNSLKYICNRLKELTLQIIMEIK
jgi:hypothetical protein